MLIRLGYDLEYNLPRDLPMVALLNLHPSRAADARQPDLLHVQSRNGSELHNVPVEIFQDSFGNCCARFLAPAGKLRLWNDFTLEDPGVPDILPPNNPQTPVQSLPSDTLQFLLASRYCEVDQLQPFADELFGHVEGATDRVKAVCNWIHGKMIFAYGATRPTKTAKDMLVERIGVCRDYQHLAVTFCRCLNIPARYVTGYIGDIGVPFTTAMDFSAWFEAWIDGRWWTFDARHNHPRIGRVLMAAGRDAADVALTTAFGNAPLTKFIVIAEEVGAPPAQGAPLPLAPLAEFAF